ncbi:hypothetical protein E2562_022352 [Oryza meyeriana var. granulata]|uniref:F-box domain-containing protein n=1 Tax=Oryza meyeriana var. granulata TaxID=110450 RepID=A0A6G1DLU7_9ORYZ|nr:hypothetical protein E2562_022352 [Oryza meyeriana var. granulata]
MAAGGPTCVDDISDDVLEMVLMRLRSAACLIRAASVCKRWRRVIVTADGVFLRRFRAHHGPDLVGHYHYVGASASDAAFVHVSRPVLVSSGRLSLDFVPDTDSWTIADSRGSLVLLGKRSERTANVYYCLEFIFCEPLTRRYQLVPVPTPEMKRRGKLGAFLADGDDELGGRIGMSSYRVCTNKTRLLSRIMLTHRPIPSPSGPSSSPPATAADAST